MITLITAVPGSGKTLYAIGLIEAALSEGRPVFTNISGLVKDKFSNPHLLSDAPDDWRDTPEGSLVVYDEAQQAHLYLSNAQRGPVTDERLTAMETHRHTGHDLVFITQAPTFVHHHIRKLVGLHIHLYRSRGLQAASKYEWSHVCDSPNDRKEQQRADFVLWKFPKEHFAFYTSAVMHTHKFKMPKKIGVLLVFVVLGLGAVGFNLYKNSGLASMAEATASVAEATPSPLALNGVKPSSLAAPYQWSAAAPAVPVSGCVANRSTNRCQCFDASGVVLAIEHAACLSVISSPLPRQLLSTSK
ncbi:unknown protein [Pseudomonas phage Pf3]|uniref:hypothetical protein n=1 Tax=Pseudomonas phage Pf3 TaxID=10872 RepID=UPI000016D76D|nr:hypothetical protein QJ535_gp6 [Pseudomonas phage Pf3]AAA88391.1 unknown protein [Pseudomonas phage Pf3]